MSIDGRALCNSLTCVLPDPVSAGYMGAISSAAGVLAEDFLAGLRAVDFLADDLRVDLRVDLRAALRVDFLADDLRAALRVDFLADDLRAVLRVDFLAVDLRAVLRVDLRAVLRVDLRVDLRAVDFLAVLFLAAFFTAMFPPPFGASSRQCRHIRKIAQDPWEANCTPADACRHLTSRNRSNPSRGSTRTAHGRACPKRGKGCGVTGPGTELARLQPSLRIDPSSGAPHPCRVARRLRLCACRPSSTCENSPALRIPGRTQAERIGPSPRLIVSHGQRVRCKAPMEAVGPNREPERSRWTNCCALPSLQQIFVHPSQDLHRHWLGCFQIQTGSLP